MTLLNLNSPAGRGPRGKKSLKMFMGAGLLVAVLGIGSTLAANITLNSPDLTTEFGQGVTQTVYCGGDASVTVTPISTYVNTVIGNPSGGSAEVFFTAKFQNTALTGDSNFIRSNAATKVINGITGIWLTQEGSSGSIATNQNQSTFSTSEKSNYVFAYPATRDSNAGFYRVNSSSPTKVVITAAVAPTPGATTAASFKVGGVVISNIPAKCAGKDFVLSAYPESGGTPTTLISKSSPSETVKEVAVAFTRVAGTAVSSTDRSLLKSSSLVSATQTSTSVKIVFETTVSGATALSADSLYKLVVETQEDTIG
jgi:hypothetical protein